MNDGFITAIGLMSGTSIDGIDISLIKSDGYAICEGKLSGYYSYDSIIKDALRRLIDNEINSLGEIKNIENLITQKHIDVVDDFLKKNNLESTDIDIIGFHGHTVVHNPDNSITWQIGNSQMLASKLAIDVVADFRSKDVANGGQGAPLVPIYHHALFKDYSKSVVVLNIGCVSNITYLKDSSINNIVACDICFGNAPMDDLINKFNGSQFDRDGELAGEGKVNYDLANRILKQEYFSRKLPKSLDRNHFRELLNKELLSDFDDIAVKDALRTFCYIIAKSLDVTIDLLGGNDQKKIIVCGGGRKNKTLMNMLAEVCGNKVSNIDDLGFDGDSIEAEAFAFLAVRNLKGLPISFKRTTGVLSEKCNAQTLEEGYSSSCGGVFYRA